MSLYKLIIGASAVLLGIGLLRSTTRKAGDAQVIGGGVGETKQGNIGGSIGVNPPVAQVSQQGLGSSDWITQSSANILSRPTQAPVRQAAVIAQGIGVYNG